MSGPRPVVSLLLVTNSCSLMFEVLVSTDSNTLSRMSVAARRWKSTYYPYFESFACREF